MLMIKVTFGFRQALGPGLMGGRIGTFKRRAVDIEMFIQEDECGEKYSSY